MTMSRKGRHGGRMIASAACSCKALSFPRRQIIWMMIHGTYDGWYEWTSEPCRFFVVLLCMSILSIYNFDIIKPLIKNIGSLLYLYYGFTFLPYFLMVLFPKLLLLWTAFFILAMWLPALFAPKTFIRVMENSLKNTDIVRVWAFIVMILWLLFLSVYQKFTASRLTFFSLFGYLSLLKWLVLLRFPNYGYKKYKRFYSKPIGSITMWIFVVLFSLFILRIAYYKI